MWKPVSSYPNKVIFDDSGPYREPTEIEILQDKIFNCKRDIILFTDYIRFKNGKRHWSKLIAKNEGMIKECQIRIALLGG